jgi:hypothetical protein
MTFSEYEEWFHSSAPSLHQTFAATRGRNRCRHWRRIWLAAAAAVMLTITYKAASHHAVHSRTTSHSRATAAQGREVADNGFRRIQTYSLREAGRRC